jgi:hypothetical protein
MGVFISDCTIIYAADRRSHITTSTATAPGFVMAIPLNTLRFRTHGIERFLGSGPIWFVVRALAREKRAKARTTNQMGPLRLLEAYAIGSLCPAHLGEGAAGKSG